ncbi:MAG: HD domain-containing phosphohydrolase [bacterium]
MFKISDEIVARFLETLGEKDPYSKAHSERVGALMERFAVEMRIFEVHVPQMKLAGMLHDIGKLDTSEEILKKISLGESLSTEEKRALEPHVESVKYLSKASFLPATVILAIRHHHENWDGSGYPDQLSGDAIPHTARMLAVCDVYDAVTADLQNRKGMPPAKAAALITKLGGSRLDPKLAAVFVRKIVSPNIKTTLLQKIINYIKKIFKKTSDI